ncbi:helix-turn-helix domain-containing protein [Actinoallomurus iriomotensis]|uniref:AraC family transcriptional regulator n=1 Tax=Actinoallomurus iriomotensis TaxID=478107 RepID=A0A9W6RT67_9ACTN|nr:helix-turn-helix domain-containing protein [Actinoallomurus iriomotensis]GLY81288.1 AraC family transcriptional regulator [Actinoallomurus iriomotensis]
MRTVTPVTAGDGFRVERVVIRATTEDWTDPDPPSGHRLTLVCGGVFRARVGGHAFPADPVTAYLGGPADEQSIAHRVGAEDVCTVLSLSPSFMIELTGGVPVRPTAAVTGRLAVTHRLLLARARRSADPFALADLTADLVGGLFDDRRAHVAEPSTRPATGAARRALADAARELLTLDPVALGLRETARRLGCSPYHLSRVFHRQTGLTLSAYRTRVRVLRAIEAGRADLAGLAADLGFADHAHLTRTVREECGHTPRALRRLLVAD